MHSPLDRGSWRSLDAQGIRDVVTLMNAQLRASGDSGTVDPLIVASDGKSHLGSLVVRGGSWRPLSFYPPDWSLYEIECATEGLSSVEGYESVAFTYAVCGPAGGADRCALIDWTVAPLSRLNRLLELDLSALDGEVVRDYLLFFCTYLGGSPDAKGAVSPFLLPQDASWFAWEQALEDLEVLAEERHLLLFTPMADLNGEDEFDLPVKPAVADGRHAKRKKRPKVEAASTRRKAVEAIFADYPQTPTEIRSSVGIDSGTANVVATQPGAQAPTEAAAESQTAVHIAPVPVARYQGLVWFGDSLFLSEFEIFRSGEVAMAEDQLIVNRLPVPLWEVRRGPANLRLLCRQMKRDEISAPELLRRIEARIDQDVQDNFGPGPARSRLRGLRVDDEVKWPSTFKDRVRLEDVEFLYDVVLDDAIFERSLELLNCRFLCRLSARNATVKGALRLSGSRLDGATDFTGAAVASGLGFKQPQPVLDFCGLKVERGLFADQLTAFGRMQCEWMRVGATMRARGLQVHPGAPDVEATFDLSHTQIDGPLDLQGDVAEQREPGGSRRTVLGLPATLVGLRADQVDLNGIWVRGFLDLASCDIKGRLTISLVQLQGSPSHLWWRPRIDGYLSLDRSKTGLVAISGCQVGGDLHLVELQLSGSLMAGMQERFRTRVGGDFVGSGATVRDTIELDGAHIGGEILFVTGRFSRLSAGVAAWAAPDATSGRLVPSLCSCEASGMALQDVSVGASMYLLGLKLHGQNNTYSHGGMIARGISLGGGLRFGFGPTTMDLLSKQLLNMIKVDALLEVERADALVTAVVSNVQADICGGLDLRGISTGDTTDLSRLRTGGIVHLENSRVEGNLRTYAEGIDISCSAEGFCADIARIGGDCDLRGLEVRRGNLTARDIEVAGQILLATEVNHRRRDASGTNPVAHTLVREGCVDLEGAKAARLVLSSVNTTETRHASEIDPADIVISRGRFGQLTINGFEPASRRRFRKSSLCFPRRINLIAVQADDWEIASNAELPLLKATMPHSFDGRIFVELEQRLAKIGKKNQADRIYRNMLLGSASGVVAWVRNRLNFVFSGNGTKPWLMFLWLLLFLLPVVWVVGDPANVEFITSEGTTSALPISDGRVYDLKRDWDWTKAVGLAGSYALPFLSGGRFDVVRARLVGPICIGTPPHKEEGATNSGRCLRHLPIALSPHGFAMIFSTIQFLLWILVAANLPAIARRRP
jgi:hypothetical protein